MDAPERALAQPYDRLRVVDLSSGIAGAYTTKTLTDLGAAVARLEPPNGVDLRRWSALRPPQPASVGLLFDFLSAGQHSRTVDVASDTARQAALDLAADADVIVWSPGSPVADHPAFAPHALRTACPNAIVVTITSFGLDGPWSDRPATEFTVQALSGGVAHRGPVGEPPWAVGGQHGEWVAGAFAAIGALVALLRRDRFYTGGELVDVSMLEALVMTPHFNSITYQSISGEAYFVGRRPRYPGDIEPTADGWAGFALVNALQHWLDFCVMIGHPEWVDDEALQNPTRRAGRYAEITPQIRAWTTARTTREIVEEAALFRVPAVEVGHGANVADMDQFVERRFFQHRPGTDIVQPAPVIRFDGALPAEDAAPPAPLGPPVETALPTWPDRPTSTAEPSARAHTSTGDPTLPLAGVRILDLTAYWAGPFATHLPAMLGAEVLHVESHTRLDGARVIVPRNAPRERTWEWSHAFQSVNTNKAGLAIDLATEDGRALLGQLVDACDVVVENSSPRVLEQWGFGHDVLCARRPELIVLRMPAFGLQGPWRDRTGFAMTMEQVSGMAWLTGPADGPPVTLLGPCDPVGGAHGVIALLAALERRHRTGRGGLVELPMVSAALTFCSEQVLTFTATGERLDRAGNRGPGGAPQNLYRCADTDPDGQPRWVAVAVTADGQWARLCQTLGYPAWATDAALATAAGRFAAHDQIDAELGEWCASRPAAEAADTIRGAGVPAEVVTTTGELLGLAPLHARPFLEEVAEHPVTGRTLHTTYPIRFEHPPDRWHRRAAPTVGQDNRTVLTELVGLTDDELDRLEATGVIGTR